MKSPPISSVAMRVLSLCKASAIISYSSGRSSTALRFAGFSNGAFGFG